MAPTIKLRVVRELWHGGKQHAPGDYLDLPAAAAADFLESTRVELVDGADRPAVWAGRTGQVQRELRQHGRTMPAPGSPWAPVNY
jgi:non-ribosomal peptide synthetase component F